VQQEVERQPCAAGRRGLGQPQGTAFDGQVGAGRDDIQVPGFDRHPVRGLQHRQGGALGQQVHEQAVLGGVEVLDQDEGHRRIGGQGVQQLPAGLKLTGRCAHGDD